METEKKELKLIQDARIHGIMMEKFDDLDVPIILKQIAAEEAKLHGSKCVEYGKKNKKQKFEILGLELLVQVGYTLKSYYDTEYQMINETLIQLYQEKGDKISLCKVYTNWAKIFLNEYKLENPEIRNQIQIYLDTAHMLAYTQEITTDKENQPEWYKELWKTTSHFEDVKFQFENT